MAYDEELGERVRAALGAVPGVAEIKMFGGLCYTVRGHMAVGVNGDDLMVRMEPEAAEASWIGRRLAEVEESWGKPSKVKAGPDGQKIYHFHQKLTMLEVVEMPGFSYADAGIGPGSSNQPGHRGTYSTEVKGRKVTVSTTGDPFETPVITGGPELIDRPVASRKARFWIDEQGVVVAETIGEMKWKKGYGPIQKQRP